MSARRAAGWLASCLAATAAAQQDVAFARDVLPILERSCFQCHRGEHTDANGRLRKPKGGLRLDGKAWILRGGKEGVVLVAGKAQQSPLYTRTALPADHDERMPATGDPLAREQTEILRRWIDAGADFGEWEGEAGPAVAAQPQANTEERAPAAGTRTLDLARVAEGLAPLPTATIAKAAGDKAQITPLWHGAALLRVEFPGHEDHVGDAEVAALAPLREHVAVLVLARSKVTDAVGKDLARMPRLVRLDLRDSEFGDAGVARLRGLAELRALNLFGTKVSDAAVDVLAAMPKLSEVRLWQSKVTAAGLAKLTANRADLDVVLAPDLPTPAPPATGGQGRRRGR